MSRAALSSLAARFSLLCFLFAAATSASTLGLDEWLRRAQAERNEELATSDIALSAELREGLGDNELLLVFGRLSASHLGVAALRREATLGPVEIDMPIEVLTREVERLHSLLRSGSRPARGQLLRLTDALGDALLEPVSDLLPGAEVVRLVTTAPLDELPFASSVFLIFLVFAFVIAS